MKRKANKKVSKNKVKESRIFFRHPQYGEGYIVKEDVHNFHFQTGNEIKVFPKTQFK
jgi:hypothetical protein